MEQGRSYRNLGYSFLAVALLTIFVVSFFFHKDDSTGGLSGWFLFVIAHYIGIGVGTLLIILRLVGSLKRNSLVYVFFMVLNITIGLTNLGLVFFADIAQSPLWFYISFNLLLGAASLVDVFLIDQLYRGSNFKGKQQE